MMALRPIETSGNTPPATQCHIPEHMNPQQHLCAHLKSRSVLESPLSERAQICNPSYEAEGREKMATVC
jgi:hypothetical protein